MTSMMLSVPVTSSDPNSPAWLDPKLHKYRKQRDRCEDVLCGTDTIQEAAQKYLPKLPRETIANYRIRLRLAEVVNLFAGAVRAAEGLMIAEPPTLMDGVSPAMTALWQDLDGRQTGGPQWTRGVLRHMLCDGWCLAVMATPVKAGGLTTKADEQVFHLRPFVTVYKADHVMSARFTRIGGRLVLSQLVLKECPEDADGTFGMRTIDQYRVLMRLDTGLHTSQVYREDRGQYVAYGPVEVIETQELPVVEFSSLADVGFGQAPPALLELADLTLSHWRVLSDRRWALKQACFPWLVRIGFVDDGTTTAGVNDALDLPIGGSAQWIAPPPEAMQPTRDELQDIERRAAALSLSFLSGESTGDRQTATAATIDQQGQDASLAAMAINVRDSLNRMGAILAEMLGEPVQDTYFAVNTTFRGLRRDPVYLRVLLDVWKAGGLPLDALLYALENGEMPDEFDAEEAAARAMAEADAAAQAALDQQQQLMGADPAAGGRPAVPPAAPGA